MKNGIFNTLDYPGSTWTLLRSISNDGLVLGFYWTFPTSGPTITNNFLWKDGQFKVLPSDGSFNCFQSKPCPNATNFLDTNGKSKFVGSFYPPTLPPDQYTDGFVATCKDVF